PDVMAAATIVMPAIETPSEGDDRQDRGVDRGPGPFMLPAPPAEEPASLSGEVRSTSGTGVHHNVSLPAPGPDDLPTANGAVGEADSGSRGQQRIDEH